MQRMLIRMALRGLKRALKAQRKQTPSPKPAVPGTRQIHVFNGPHDRETLEAYCYDAPSADAPEPFTRDLPDAFIDADHIWIREGATTADALVGFGLRAADMTRFDDARTGMGWIVLYEEGLGGLPYTLHDTPTVAYLGTAQVPVDRTP